MCRNVPEHTVIDFIPQFGKKQFVLCVMGDFFDIFPIHFITGTIIPYMSGIAREVLLVLLGILCYNM